MYKPFQIVLVVFLVFFTAAGLVLFISPIASLFWPTETNGITAISGGISVRLFNLIVIVGLLLLLTIAGIYLLSRRSKLR
jgi:hypothetical protein